MHTCVSIAKFRLSEPNFGIHHWIGGTNRGAHIFDQNEKVNEYARNSSQVVFIRPWQQWRSTGKCRGVYCPTANPHSKILDAYPFLSVLFSSFWCSFQENLGLVPSPWGTLDPALVSVSWRREIGMSNRGSFVQLPSFPIFRYELVTPGWL